jgi:hypothetical protein
MTSTVPAGVGPVPRPGAPGAAPGARPDAAAEGAAADGPARAPSATGEGASLALVALVLGIAGTVLGVTVVWFFAAIPLGVAAMTTGWLARRRPLTDHHRTRAVLGAVLGLVALLLGVLGAIFLPPILHRADLALSNAETDLTSNIDQVDSSLSRDVDRLDTTVSRDLRRLERRNRDDLLQFEAATGATLDRLEARIGATEKNFSAQEKADLARLEQQLRADLATLEQSLRGADTDLYGQVAALEARVRALEARLGL